MSDHGESDSMNVRGLVRVMAAFGAAGVGIALLIHGLGMAIGGRFEELGNFSMASQLLDAVSPVLWPVTRFPDLYGSVPNPHSQQELLTEILLFALLNFIPYALVGACFYVASSGLRALRSHWSRSTTTGGEH
jgi:hypothetical protein